MQGSCHGATSSEFSVTGHDCPVGGNRRDQINDVTVRKLSARSANTRRIVRVPRGGTRAAGVKIGLARTRKCPLIKCRVANVGHCTPPRPYRNRSRQVVLSSFAPRSATPEPHCSAATSLLSPATHPQPSPRLLPLLAGSGAYFPSSTTRHECPAVREI